MYKEKLQNYLFESFINDKIDSDQLVTMTNNVEKISESSSKRILNEFGFISIALIMSSIIYISNKYFDMREREIRARGDQQQLNRLKVTSYKVGIREAKKALRDKCPNSEDPKKCKSVVSGLITKYKNKIDSIQD